MKNKGNYINLFLGILMLVANLLPALHAHDSFYSVNSGNEEISTEIPQKISKLTVACDLCDFNFSSSIDPAIFSYDLHLPGNYRLQKISIEETVSLFPQTDFSLRAPPVKIA